MYTTIQGERGSKPKTKKTTGKCTKFGPLLKCTCMNFMVPGYRPLYMAANIIHWTNDCAAVASINFEATAAVSMATITILPTMADGYHNSGRDLRSRAQVLHLPN